MSTACAPSAARQRALGVVLVAVGVLGPACAARRVVLPTDAGSPFSAFQQVHAEVTAACRAARTLTAELTLSGRAGDERVRGRMVAGFEQPASMRLEAVAPFGQPAFILAAEDDASVLLLPRDRRVLEAAAAEDVLGALTGVRLAPADLQAILTGCVTPGPVPADGRLHRDGWASIELADGSTVYLRQQQDVWEVRAARRGAWDIEYLEWVGRFPRIVRLVSTDQSVPVDVTATVSQLEVNVEIDPAAFTVIVPTAFSPLSVDELRRAGPLRETP